MVISMNIKTAVYVTKAINEACWNNIPGTSVYAELLFLNESECEVVVRPSPTCVDRHTFYHVSETGTLIHSLCLSSHISFVKGSFRLLIY